MTSAEFHPPPTLLANAKFQFVVFLLVIALLANLNAIVDAIFHPDIEYFDEEHLIVGGTTALVSGVLFGLVILYARHLEQALKKISALEAFLPICANCKKIKTIGKSKIETWQPIDTYISARTNTKFSHGICPDCLKKLYPDYAK